jgi:hypothetical protein
MTNATIAGQLNAIIALALSSSPSVTPNPISRPDTLKGVDDLIHAGFEAYRASCFNWLLFATALVVLGLVLEGPELWEEIRTIIRRWRFRHGLRSSSEEHGPDWVKLLAFVGWILIVLGVAGEYVADSFVSKADGFVQTFDETLLAEAERASSEAILGASAANRQVAVARQRTAELENGAAQLRKEAEDERLARAKIEARVAWRHLTDDQQQDIARQLGDFSNAEGASFWSQAGDTEAGMFAADLANAVKLAHIVVQPPGEIVTMQASGKFGDPIRKLTVGVTVLPTKDDRSLELAKALIQVLNARGFDATRQTDPPFKPEMAPQIEVFVHPRPEGPQGEYKLEAESQAKRRQ